MIQLNRILHPTDFSDASNAALKYATALASRFGSELQVIHVHQPIASAAMVSPGGTLPPEVEADEQARAAASLESLSVADEVPPEKVKRQLLVGMPFLQIVRYARETDVDLIVIGTHGRSGLEHVLLGSVAEKIVRKASCPVLTIRPAGHQFVMP